MQSVENNLNKMTRKVRKKNEAFGILTIDIEKLADKPLGFYIQQNEISGGIFINEVKSETLKGLLCVNDEIISINDKIIKNLNLDDIVSVMLSMTSFSLTIKRSSVDDESRPYDIVNGKVDQSYSHKLFNNTSNCYDDNEDYEVGETCTKIKSLFNDISREEENKMKKVNELSEFLFKINSFLD